MKFSNIAVTFFVASAIAIACGGSKWPLCENDGDCNQEGHKGVCLNGKCVECRDNAACGVGRECKDGTCSNIEGYCDDTKACAGGATCGKDHRCQKPVSANEPVECDDTHPCKTGEKCQNGHCVAPPKGGPGCTDFPSPKFAYESPILPDEAKKTLERLAGCLKASLKGASVLLVGHCDARGEYEFNMGLGAERAEQARTFLTGLGVSADLVKTTSRGKLDANGGDEAGWQNDRRVDIEVR